jgi:glutamine synthetase
VLTTADRVVTLRYLLNVLAQERGMIATFMPKPFANVTGSGFHLHLSLRNVDTGVSVFPATDADALGLGLSPTAYSFVAGILDHATALQAVIAPTVNSYKRTGSTASSASGATWAPKQPTFGGNDRTHFVRIPDGQRIELRGGDGAANPYLAIAAAVTAGLDGIANGLELGAVGTGPNRSFPLTLLHAVEAFEDDKVVRGALDAAGPGVSDYFAKLKKDEFVDYHAAVSEWEYSRYLTAF